MPECLDYANGDFRELELRTTELTLLENIDYGCSEGIYVTFDIRIGCSRNNQVYHFGTFKTLENNREGLRAMGLLMADFVYEFYDFLNNHIDDFDWTGFGVIPYREDGTLSCVDYCAETEESAKARALTIRSNPTRVRITDKANRISKDYDIVEGALRKVRNAS